MVSVIVVDTAFFTGNYPPFASVEGCGVDGYPDPADELRRRLANRSCRARR